MGRLLRLLCLVPLYVAWYFLCEYTALWSRFSEFGDVCDHPELAVNHSGVKVLVAGFAKTGTRSMSRALYQIGEEHSYHSEEFGLHVWANLADKYWLQQNGGRWSQLPPPSFLHNANKRDEEVLRATSSEELAAALSRCRVDALAFDGIESLFWPVYAVSPGAKVILMNWRSFEEWVQSLLTFGPRFFLEVIFIHGLHSSVMVLPWGGLFHLIDPLVGGRIQQLLRSGGPPICQVQGAYVGTWFRSVSFRRVVSRWFSGIGFLPQSKEMYDGMLNSIKEQVPPENLLEWDMRKNTFEDLCKFLGKSECPRSGRLPRARNLMIFLDFPVSLAIKVPPLLALHWVNWKIFGMAFSVLLSPCARRSGRRKEE